MYSRDQLLIFTEPQQGATYDDLLAVTRRAEQLGFGAFFRSDHHLAMGDVLEAGGLPGPTDAWTTLAGIARDTTTIRLGTLVTSATFRLAGPLAISVAGVDQMSGGRVELGLGVGWYERARGQRRPVPFARRALRAARVPAGAYHREVGDSRGLAVLLRGATHHGHGLPGAARAGAGRRRADRDRRRWSAADAGAGHRCSAEYNLPFAPISRFDEQKELVAAACVDVDRDPASITYTAARVVCVGADDAEVARRARRHRAPARRGAPQRRRRDARRGAREMGRWAEAGAERLYLQVLDLAGLDHLDAIADLVS